MKLAQKARLRTSTPAASRCTPAPTEVIIPARAGRSCGGRLSTTYQSRSSRALAARERPAPDMPVTMIISGRSAGRTGGAARSASGIEAGTASRPGPVSVGRGRLRS